MRPFLTVIELGPETPFRSRSALADVDDGEAFRSSVTLPEANAMPTQPSGT
jgi:hypothetical protein